MATDLHARALHALSTDGASAPAGGGSGAVEDESSSDLGPLLMSARLFADVPATRWRSVLDDLSAGAAPGNGSGGQSSQSNNATDGGVVGIKDAELGALLQARWGADADAGAGADADAGAAPYTVTF